MSDFGPLKWFSVGILHIGWPGYLCNDPTTVLECFQVSSICRSHTAAYSACMSGWNPGSALERQTPRFTGKTFISQLSVYIHTDSIAWQAAVHSDWLLFQLLHCYCEHPFIKWLKCATKTEMITILCCVCSWGHVKAFFGAWRVVLSDTEWSEDI